MKGDPDAGVSFAEIADIAYFKPHALPAGMPAGLEASARGTRRRSPVIWANATHVCTCEVDVTTGAVTLLRYIVSEDCGPMINPSVVEGQIAGGAVQGIGGALFEHLAYDDDGNPLATTFMDYLLPTARRGAGRSSTATSRRPAPAPAATRAWARAARSARRRPSSTRWPTRWRRSGVDDHPAAARRPAAIVGLIDRRGRQMKPAAVRLPRARTAPEAVGLLAELGDGAKVLAGGQSLVPLLAMRLAAFEHLIDIGRVAGAARHRAARRRPCWIGAATTRRTIERSALDAPTRFRCWPGPRR